MTKDASGPLQHVRFAEFIAQHTEAILVEWEAFARTRIPAAATMSLTALKNHAERILRAIAADMTRRRQSGSVTRRREGLPYHSTTRKRPPPRMARYVTLTGST